MIDYLSGQLTEITPTSAIVECGGIGYEVNISLIDFTSIQNEKNVKLYIHEAIREDAHLLYGFTSKRGRELFRLLIGVSGVGPNTARLILSAITVTDLEQTIASGNDSILKSVKGIGAKTAQRIIVDLKDKIKVGESTLISMSPTSSESYDEALSALIMLGFTSQQSQKVLKKLFADTPSITVENAIKMALKML
ncbi:MAG: Holliday junction branch migration protein RuvA [Muribaculaceae bacterium]|jgi:Holliday junction DNA helicase RuvA|nr:Holliday junction branch migration protein RuvA [Muribaculaceae bacterium]MBQ1184538.1 Holliday junction branch migration protein RuvA [Muribaculaceae bacterium]MBQ2370868.1 Holliday junction branch migration protein RuvA [Muribaculaceae bacterium]MBQ2400119.1 Holliday junction branch migration protein RuvA [Muribaculaceae bacterium]MBQ5723375.1 Holliday junction branch migration protein RuvA [Muribaculaceae bacterium]